MFSHLTFSDQWEECLCEDECLYWTRVDQPLNLLEALPLRWAEEAYLGGASQRFKIYRAWKNEQGEWHRLTGPAIVFEKGDYQWHYHGQLHRIGGPAVKRLGVHVSWYQNGQLHRSDGPAIIHEDGKEEWYQGGKLHREDGPALTHPDGTQEWRLFGELHRADGPARVYPDGFLEWWEDNVFIRDNEASI